MHGSGSVQAGAVGRKLECGQTTPPRSAMLTTEAVRPEPDSSCDVFVLGGGPAGSTIGALLAQRGWNVVIVDNNPYPRFDAGESLLPLNMPFLEHLGVYDA